MVLEDFNIYFMNNFVQHFYLLTIQIITLLYVHKIYKYT